MLISYMALLVVCMSLVYRGYICMCLDSEVSPCLLAIYMRNTGGEFTAVYIRHTHGCWHYHETWEDHVQL